MHWNRPEETISVLTHRWVIPVLGVLAQAPHRPAELRARLGVSERALYNVLDLLRHHGLINDTVHATAPRHVVYQLTADGYQAYQIGLSLTHHIRSGSQPATGLAAGQLRAYATSVSDNFRSIRPVDTSKLDAERLPEIDTTIAHPARVYNYSLGGKDNFEADRVAAERIFELNPDLAEIARENRRFLVRTVRYLISECGIRQFIDIGTGIPTQENTHEVAQKLAPDIRVAYVDNDPIVITHGRALLAGTSGVNITHGDFREPESILQNPHVKEVIDFEQPVALLLVAILHFISDENGPHQLLAAYRDAMPDGSYVVISHVEDNPITSPGKAIYTTAAAPAAWRSREEISEFFDGSTLVDPGLVYIPQWRPNGNEYQTNTILGGVGKINA